MSFDLETLRDAVARHGRVTRVVVAAVDGSTPRDVGAAMLVWADGQSGTIGGGTLEFEAAEAARQGGFFRRVPLGPAIGQCCGGAVTLLAEVFDARRLEEMDADFLLRRVEGAAEVPLTIQRAIAAHRNSGAPIVPLLVQGWMLEPVTRPTRQLWIYGAGHVGRALVNVMSPIPEVAITWVDTAANRFPSDLPSGVTKLVAANPATVVRYAPPQAEHLVLTYSHALDLELCHQLLSHSFAFAGLIGSDTKWARFRKRLQTLGHAPDQIARITCPIGQKALGKHPQAIALGVATEFLIKSHKKENKIRGVS